MSPSGSSRVFAVFRLGLVAALAGTCAKPTGADDTGAIALALVAQGADGAKYRLSSAKFEIVGPDVVTVDGDGEMEVIRRLLKAGSYTIELKAGWKLDRLGADNMWSPVEAVLASMNPASLRILRGVETPSKWEFLLRATQGTVAISFGVTPPSAMLGLFYPDDSPDKPYDFEVYFPLSESKTGAAMTGDQTMIKWRSWKYGPTAVNWISEPHPLLAGIKGELKVTTEYKVEVDDTKLVKFTPMSSSWSGLKLEGVGTSPAPQYSMAKWIVQEGWSFEPSTIEWLALDREGYPPADLKFSTQTPSYRFFVDETGLKRESKGKATFNFLSPAWLFTQGWTGIVMPPALTWTAPNP